MIAQVDIMPILLNACPQFRPTWEAHLQYWNGEERGIFIDTAEFVHYIISQYEQGIRADLPAAFDAIETLIIQGTSDTRNIAKFGILETLQTAASHHSFGAKAFVPYLQPASKISWDEIAVLWEGKASLMDVIRSEANDPL